MMFMFIALFLFSMKLDEAGRDSVFFGVQRVEQRTVVLVRAGADKDDDTGDGNGENFSSWCRVSS